MDHKRWIAKDSRGEAWAAVISARGQWKKMVMAMSEPPTATAEAGTGRRRAGGLDTDHGGEGEEAEQVGEEKEPALDLGSAWRSSGALPSSANSPSKSLCPFPMVGDAQVFALQEVVDPFMPWQVVGKVVRQLPRRSHVAWWWHGVGLVGVCWDPPGWPCCNVGKPLAVPQIIES